jgi:signal transduction histidine kinase
LHDGLGPVLSAVNLYFQAYYDAPATEKEAIRHKIQEVISGAIDDVSRISHNISPHILEVHGLNTAVKNFISTLVGQERIQVEYHSEFYGRIDRNKELTVYRCITELFNNTLKHADASRITLNLARLDRSLSIQYTDNGKGFDLRMENHEGMGLYNMKNRVEACGGQITMDNLPGQGIRTTIEIPL